MNHPYDLGRERTNAELLFALNTARSDSLGLTLEEIARIVSDALDKDEIVALIKHLKKINEL